MLLQEDTNNINNNTKQHIKSPPKPDDESYKAALEEIKNSVDKLQEELNAVEEKINAPDNEPADNNREELRSQLDKLRGKQAEIRKTRSGIFEQLKVMNDSLQRKKRDLKQNKDNVQYKSVKEIDLAIDKLERKIESGAFTILEERQMIGSITNLKRSKKSVKQFEGQQIAIDNEQKAIDELRKTLDDSDFKKYNEEYDQIKAQLDELNKDYALDKEKRDELYDEKRKLREKINEQHARRREIQDQHNKAKQEYRRYQEEDFKRRRELRRKQAEEREIQQKKEIAAMKREEAAIPAFQLDILNCDNLIHYFQSQTGKSAQQPSSPTTPTTPITPITPITPTTPIDSNIRQPDATSHVPEGTVLMKKSDRSDDYFVGGGKKHKKSQKERKLGKSGGYQLPLSIMEQLNSVNVAVPISSSDVEQTIENLIQKKKYFIENQDRVTKENIEKAEAEIAAMEGSSLNYHKKKGNNINNNEKNDKDEATAVTTKDDEKVEDITAIKNEKGETTDTIEDSKDKKAEVAW